MSLLSAADQQKLREAFDRMTRSVRLLFFSQAIGCETCGETRQILDELRGLSDRISVEEINLVSDRISVEEINLVLEGDKAKQYGVDRTPAIAIAYGSGSSESGRSRESGGSSEASSTGDGRMSDTMKDSRIRFLGAPSGWEFVSLVQAVLLAGGRESALSAASLDRLRAVDRPITMQVFTTPT